MRVGNSKIVYKNLIGVSKFLISNQISKKNYFTTLDRE